MNAPQPGGGDGALTEEELEALAALCSRQDYPHLLPAVTRIKAAAYQAGLADRALTDLQGRIADSTAFLANGKTSGQGLHTRLLDAVTAYLDTQAGDAAVMVAGTSVSEVLAEVERLIVRRGAELTRASDFTQSDALRIVREVAAASEASEDGGFPDRGHGPCSDCQSADEVNR